ncbi:hypothetical protein Cgig2_022426 [Carnegiea gigantea]|uniref:Uncharacterized protein n=1 Tax=Carnegiea gigantea TaxID=171969 RepID=A0A9Q1JK20_9CARY|nr:hypothetical protein Cgig2_022426 [Carnegiea gigantea]
MRYAHNSHVPEMTQVIFYAMMLNDGTELRLSSRIVMDCMTCEYSSTPNILSIEQDVIYPWEINMVVDRMLEFQEHRMAKTRITTLLRSPDELLAEGTFEEQARAKLLPLECGDVMAEQVDAEAEKNREEAPPLAPHMAAASAPTPLRARAPSSKGKGMEGPAQS